MKIFLFDFDGVVIDTLPIGLEVYNQLLLEYGIPTQFTNKTFTDMFLTNFHSGLAEIITDDIIREEILQKRAAEYVRRKDDFVIFDGMHETVTQMSKSADVIIISSNRTHFIETLLESRDLNIAKEILGGDIEKSKVKKIGWQKEKNPEADIYYIGDTIGDIQEGKESSVKTVGVTWGFHSRDQMEKANPDYLFDKPEELLTLI